MNFPLRQKITILLASLLLVAFLIPHIARAQTTTGDLPPTSAPSNAAATYSPAVPASSDMPPAYISLLQNLITFGENTGLGSTDPRLIVARLIRLAMGFVGIIVLVMILLSGLAMMTSGGDEEKVSSAKKTFFNAIIGLVIMLSAYSIVVFVFNAITGASGGSSTVEAPTAPDPVVNP